MNVKRTAIVLSMLFSFALVAGLNTPAVAGGGGNHGEHRAVGHSKQRVVGRVTTIRGNVVTVVTTTGATQTFTLTPAQVATISTGQQIVFLTSPTAPFLVTSVMPAMVQPGPFVGTVQSFNGDLLTLLLLNGLTRTFTLTPAEVATVNTGEQVVLFTSATQPVMVTRVVPAVQTVSGVLVSTTKTTVVVRLPNRQLRTITVAPAAAANMLHRGGRPVVIRTRTAFTTPVSIREIIVRRP